MALKRTEAKPEPEQNESEQVKAEQIMPEQAEPEQRITDEQWAELLAEKPDSVTPPRAKPTADTAGLSKEELTSAINYDVAWWELPEYAELILRLLTWTDEQLAGYWLPAWRQNRKVG